MVSPWQDQLQADVHYYICKLDYTGLNEKYIKELITKTNQDPTKKLAKFNALHQKHKYHVRINQSSWSKIVPRVPVRVRPIVICELRDDTKTNRHS